jgi:hypothetical protein
MICVKYALLSVNKFHMNIKILLHNGTANIVVLLYNLLKREDLIPSDCTQSPEVMGVDVDASNAPCRSGRFWLMGMDVMSFIDERTKGNEADKIVSPSKRRSFMPKTSKDLETEVKELKEQVAELS